MEIEKSYLELNLKKKTHNVTILFQYTREK